MISAILSVLQKSSEDVSKKTSLKTFGKMMFKDVSFYRAKLILFIVFTFFAQSALSLKLALLDTSWLEPPAEKLQKWNPELFKTLTFGHLPTAIDWLWLKVLQDQGISHVDPEKHPAAYFDLDLASDLDPAFSSIYVAGGNYLAVIREDIFGARDLLLKGERFRTQELSKYPKNFQDSYWGFSWSIPVLLAYTYIFGLNDMPHAAEAFRSAEKIPGAPDYLHDLVARLEKPGGEYEVGVKLLDFMIIGSKDEHAKERLEQKRSSLYIGELLFQINSKFSDYIFKQKLKPNALTSPETMQKYWESFCTLNHKSLNDPYGGKFFWDPELKKIASTTPHQKVFGLD